MIKTDWYCAVARMIVPRRDFSHSIRNIPSETKLREPIVTLLSDVRKLPLAMDIVDTVQTSNVFHTKH